MILHSISCGALAFLAIASAAQPQEPWEDRVGFYEFTAIEWRAPHFTLGNAVELVDTLSDDLIEKALEQSASNGSVYQEAPFAYETQEGHVIIQLDNNPEGGYYPVDFFYGTIQSLILLLRKFIREWEDVGWVPTFDIRFQETSWGGDWRGSVTQL